MGGKAERAKRARAAIDTSLADRRLVRITRVLGAAQPVDGVVVARGIRWVLVTRLSSDLDLDGYTALRWKHIAKVQPFDPDSVPARATAHDDVRPVPGDLVDTTSTGALLRSVSRSFAPIGVHTERDDRSSCAAGVVSSVVDKTVHLTLLGPSTAPKGTPVVIAFDSITRVDFDGRYFHNLARAAGCPAGPMQARRS